MSALSPTCAFTHPPVQIVFAAGNDGALGEASVGTPATAKNALVIGAHSQSLLSARYGFSHLNSPDIEKKLNFCYHFFLDVLRLHHLTERKSPFFSLLLYIPPLKITLESFFQHPHHCLTIIL